MFVILKDGRNYGLEPFTRLADLVEALRGIETRYRAIHGAGAPSPFTIARRGAIMDHVEGDLRIPAIRTIRVPNIKQRVNVQLDHLGRLLEDLRVLSDDAEACPEVMTYGNMPLTRTLKSALCDMREAVDCVQDVLGQLGHAEDTEGEVPTIPVGSDIFGHGKQEVW